MSDLAPENFGRIVDAYQSRLYGFVRRMLQDEEEALDVTQEAFVRAFRSLDRFDRRCSLRAWLFRIAHNLCIDRCRRRRTRVEEESLEAAEGLDGDLRTSDSRWNPETVALTGELLAAVDRAVDRLSPKLKAVLMLHDREQLSYEEIAGVLRLPLGTVKSRLFAARESVAASVRRYLEEAEQV
ncbi:MAG: sigma-70 family RNA polymerase sigma factor [Fimbriimonadales bacterium]|nr:sigma-70 family RNA polymerase sigma factor [Fimbriimonadales bacterium]